ncbi:FMN-dependent oxidoreductase (nitrilotriacetate monooxygenase family) [Paraburkholderia atlantica]|uniref:LLM class flavin-dependent oxidoreductase n=1 Tax=Paraburkholderia atlantica TaxID=2654982 RepID=UPI00128BAA54|nr:LLM class flavin-dependent oxidoreductase [Paraburkholderia atlantica]MPW08216.1 NtaA/DmoA family FMN-dependent monooxygenase [Paraburkholderia atlantica]
MTRKKKAHLLGFMQNGFNSHSTGMWRHPRDKVNWDYGDYAYWQHIARVLERGLFDALFIADQLAPYSTFQGSSDASVKYAVQFPCNEPSTIVPAVATATSRLGIGVTLSTAFEHPYSMSRRLSSLDYQSGGRIAWNIVSSFSHGEWNAYGVDGRERSDRYERLEEYMEVCYKLWRSWDDDAIIADKRAGIYADPAKIHEVEHEGRFFRCKGRHFVPPSPQRQPVLWQAGSSDRGRDFAAKHAEAVFAVLPTLDRMKEYSGDLEKRAVGRFGRAPNSVKRIFGLQTVVGESRAEAQEKFERIKECIPLEGALAWISGHFGLDFSHYSLDEYVSNIEVPGIQGLFESIVYAKNGAPVTVREAALIYAQGMGMPVAVGTASDIVDQMETYLDEGGADGFMLATTFTPGCYEEFVDWVVPELQRRDRFRKSYSGTTLRHHLQEY